MEAALKAQMEMNEQLLKEVNATRVAIGAIVTLLDRQMPGTAENLKTVFLNLANANLANDPVQARAISAIADVMGSASTKDDR